MRAEGCACRLALQELNRALRGPKAQQHLQQRQLQQQQKPAPAACRLKPGYQDPACIPDKAASTAKVSTAFRCACQEHCWPYSSKACVPCTRHSRTHAGPFCVCCGGQCFNTRHFGAEKAWNAVAGSCCANSAHRATHVACSGADAAGALQAAAGRALPSSCNSAHLLAPGI